MPYPSHLPPSAVRRRPPPAARPPPPSMKPSRRRRCDAAIERVHLKRSHPIHPISIHNPASRGPCDAAPEPAVREAISAGRCDAAIGRAPIPSEAVHNQKQSSLKADIAAIERASPQAKPSHMQTQPSVPHKRSYPAAGRCDAAIGRVHLKRSHPQADTIRIPTSEAIPKQTQFSVPHKRSHPTHRRNPAFPTSEAIPLQAGATPPSSAST